MKKMTVLILTLAKFKWILFNLYLKESSLKLLMPSRKKVWEDFHRFHRLNSSKSRLIKNLKWPSQLRLFLSPKRSYFGNMFSCGMMALYFSQLWPITNLKEHWVENQVEGVQKSIWKFVSILLLYLSNIPNFFVESVLDNS